MRSLLLLMLAAAAGVAAGVALFAFKPQTTAADELALRLGRLESEVAILHERQPSPPTHEYWERFERHLDTYADLTLKRLPPDKVGRPEFGGEQWGGVMSGPTLDLLLAARIAQALVPVHFDRVAVKDDTVQMTFYVLGAQED